MIKQKIKNEIITQGYRQADIIRGCNNIITPSQLSNFLAGNSSLHVKNIELIFEFLKIELVRIL